MTGYRYRTPAASGRFGPPVVDIALTPLSYGPVTVSTLGPSGTSSEAAAGFLLDRLLADGAGPGKGRGGPRIALRDSYEEAYHLVLKEEADLLLVANAYARISTFYMDPRLRLAGAFVLDTPQYGLATRPGRRPRGSVTVATHPAPEPLIEELMPAGAWAGEVVAAPSTSQAAMMADRDEVDLALTTELAAEGCGLAFVSRTRAIRMLWSVFAAVSTFPDPSTEATGRPAAPARKGS
ncbi:hypothetical protein [Kitasatospora sp. P5_F3]